MSSLTDLDDIPELEKKTDKINPLLFYMNIADYEEIKKDLKEIPCDQYHTNYMPYPMPHNLAREFFINHKEYTHLIVCPQDLHAKKQHYEKLIKTIKETNFDVISSVCNVERPGHRTLSHKWNICKKIPSKDRTRRYYNWVPITAKLLGIMQVEFQGFAFTAISRKVMERISIVDGEPLFRGATHKTNERFSAAPDLTFCHNCKAAGIPIYANTDIRITHYANHLPHLVGKKDATIDFIKYTPLIDAS